ncbi:hypothetical protein [Delftia sp. JD2]|uniref:hypothetical protein n=1 Tax=Delftia sp. JD2 TaxID=469553 RepID=UPI0020C7D247|nr:hypothetical protein [Delftia sp. JD2]
MAVTIRLRTEVLKRWSGDSYSLYLNQTMFFDTPASLLRPIHSLLKSPFEFAAGVSISSKLRKHLFMRNDFEDLLALGCLFDEAKDALKPFMSSLRIKLQDEFSLHIAVEDDLNQVCQREFLGVSPQSISMDSARYVTHISVQCQLERLYDHFQLKRSGQMKPLSAIECVNAIRFLMLSEALALALAGIASVKRCHEKFELRACNPVAREALRRTWFARMADQSSHAATIILANQLAQAGAKHVRDVQLLTERLLDQDLSLPWSQVPSEGRALQSVQQIYAAVEVVALLMVLGQRGESVMMRGPELIQRGLDFSKLSALVRRQDNALITDQFLMRQGNSLSLRIGSASKGLRTLFRQLEIDFCERDALSKHVGGIFFEQVTIKQRIVQGRDFQDRYDVIEGFSRDKIVGGYKNKCDVEFIIRDIQQNHYYFIQAKHALLGETAFLQAIIEAVQGDIGYGLGQLCEAKRLLDEGLLYDTLRARGISDASPKNSTFVLLHNIAQFDYQESMAGISLYDWASFRNLLKDAECQYGGLDGQLTWIRLQKPLIATNPMSVIERLLTEHPAYKRNFPDPWAQERSTMSYEVCGKLICVRGLGI